MADNLIGYDELFNFADDSQFQKALKNIDELDARYKNLAKEVKSSLDEIRTSNKAMAEQVLAQNEKLNSSNERHQKTIVENAKAAEKIVESNARLKKSEEELLKADLEHDKQMQELSKTMGILERETARLKVGIEQQVSQMKFLKKEFQAGRLSQESYIESVAKNTARQRELKAELQSAEQRLKAAAKETTSLYTSYDQMHQSLERMRKAYKALTEDQRHNEKEGKQLLKQIDALDKELKELDAQMGVHNRSVGNYAIAGKEMRTELRAIIGQMAAMRVEGKEGTEAYEQLREKAAQYKSAMANVNAETQRMASNTVAIDTVIESVQGLASAYGLATAASALLGIEDENLKKSMQKLQAVLVILNSLRQIQNLLLKTSNTYRGVELLQSKLQILSTKLETAATAKNIVVKKAATIAQWALNAAMSANPAVLILLAIVALTAAFVAFAFSGDNAAEKQKKLNDEQEASISINERLLGVFQRSDKERAKQLDNEIKRLQAQGKSLDEIKEKELEKLQLQSKIANSAKGYYSEEIKNIDANIQKIDELNEYLEKLERNKRNGAKTQVILDFETGETKRKKVKDEDLDAVRDKIQNLQKTVDIAQKAEQDAISTTIDLEKHLADEKIRLRETDNKNFLSYIDAQLLAVQRGSKRELDLQIQRAEEVRRIALKNENLSAGEISLINAKAENDKLKAQQNFNKILLADRLKSIEDELLLTRKGSDEEFELKKKQLNANLELSLINEKLTQAEILNLRTKAVKAIEDLERQRILKSKELAIQSEIDVLEIRKLQAIKGSNEIFDIEAENNIKLLELEKIRINASVDLTDGQKNAQIELATARIEAAQREIQIAKELKAVQQSDEAREHALTMERMKIEFEAQHGNIVQRITATDRLRKLEDDNLQDRMKSLEDLHDKGLIQDEEYLKEKNALSERYEQQRLDRVAEDAEREKEIRLAVADAVIDSISKINELSKAQTAERISEINIQKDAEIKAAGDNKNAIEVINDRYNKKVADEKTKQAQADKRAALIQAAINTALAVTKALPNIPLSIIAGVMGLAQIAVIAAKPIPKFWRGTRDAEGGLAYLGETGSELIASKDGTLRMSDSKKELTTLKKGDKVYRSGSEESRTMKEILGRKSLHLQGDENNLSKIAQKISDNRDQRKQEMILGMFSDRDKRFIASSFKDAVSEIHVTEDNWDERGFTRYMKFKNSKIELQHERNKTNGNG